MASIGIGERLRSARQALGLSLEEIESITHIRRSYLDALEREAFDELPGPTYIRGFLRAYAGCLGLPAQDLLDQYPVAAAREVAHRDSPVEVRITPAVRLSPVRRAMMGVGLLVGLGVLFVGFVLYTQLREFASTAPQAASPGRSGAPRSPTAPSATATPPKSAQPPAAAPKPGASPAPTPPAASPPTPAPPTPPPSTARPSTPQPAPRPAPPPSAPPAPSAPRPPAPAPAPGPAASAPAATPAPAPPASPPQTAPLNIAVAASGHTWVRGVADGATVFEGFMNAGDKQTWQAKRSLTVRVGNAAALSIEVNGKPLGPLGNVGQVYEHTFSAGAP